MSLQPQQQEQIVFQTSKLIIEDHPYQFLPNLAAIYGDTCAVILQQLHWTIQRPWFEGEKLLVQPYNGLIYIRLFPFMWFDTLEGITKHLAKSTFYRYRKSLEDCKALSVLSSLGDKIPYSSRRNDEASWYAIDHTIVQQHDAAYRVAYEEALARRQAQRAQVQFHDKDAYWRPSRDEDVSKQLDNWRACLSEHCEEQPVLEFPKPKNWGGKREKTVLELVESRQSQVETEPVSPDLKGQTAPFSVMEMSQSQVGTGPVSPDLGDFESQVGTGSVPTWELSGSQVGNQPSANLGFTPYKQTLSLERTTEDTSEAASPELSSANADTEVESSLILSGAMPDATAITETLPQPEPTPAAQQITLPSTSGIALPFPLPEPAASLAARWIEIAGDEYGLRCSEELAARVVAKSPLAVMPENTLLRLIGPDCAEIGLEKRLFGSARRDMENDVPSLRWLLFAWPGHRAEVEAWAARKNRAVNMAGAFVTKWEESSAPPKDWMAAQIAAARADVRAEGLADQERAVKAVWDGLPEPQKVVVRAEGAKRAAERGGGDWNDREAREGAERRALLLDAEFVAALPSLVATPLPASTASAQSEAASEAPYAPNPAELSQMHFHAQKLVPMLRRGELDLDGAEDYAIGHWYYTPARAAVLRAMIDALREGQEEKAA